MGGIFILKFLFASHSLQLTLANTNESSMIFIRGKSGIERHMSKIDKVPRGIQGEKSSKDTASSGALALNTGA